MIKRLVSAFTLLTLMAGNAFSQSMTISGGNDHGVVICAQGYIYAWGVNNGGQQSDLLGLDDTDPDYPGMQDFYNKPYRVNTGQLTFSQVTAGSGAFNVALACNSVVYCWGDNVQKQCGQGATVTDNVIKKPSPVLRGEAPGYDLTGKKGGDYLGGVTFVAASTAAAFAILEDGSVVGWGGKNAASWNSAPSGIEPTPVYIRLKNGDKVSNATHIAAGDDNCLIRTSDGYLLSIGPWNGRGAEAASDASCYYADTVMMADLLAGGNDEVVVGPLKNVKMSAASDGAGFAVTEDGNVYSWGNGGWGCQTALKYGPGSSTYAHKMVAGEYKEISGEDNLTDIKEIVGGRGYCLIVTKEGYLLYAGNADSDDAKANGGVIANDYDDDEHNTCLTGPQFLLYEDGSRVKDAVKIARGDNFGFMVNASDDYYAFGNNEEGQCGLGSTKKRIHALTKMKIPCTTQDACPEAFMVDSTAKCPGETIELFSGFTTPKKKEDFYFFTWSYNGKVLNTSTKDSPLEERRADIYNNTTIEISDSGLYEVNIEYIGTNVPCNTCVPVSEHTVVWNKEMPIDTLIPTSCVADSLNPTASDIINYKFKTKYKIPSEFHVYAKETGGSAIDTISLAGAGGLGEFIINGNLVTVTDRSGEENPGVYYSIWLEDATKQKGVLMPAKAIPSSATVDEMNGENFHILLTVYEDVYLESFTLNGICTYNGTATGTITPVIYGVKENNGSMVPNTADVIWKGKPTKIDYDATPTSYVVTIGDTLKGLARGKNYYLGMIRTTEGHMSLYSYQPKFPIVDELNGNTIAATSTSEYGNSSTKWGPFTDIVFSKLSSYDCGRMELTSRYWCPPCNTPDGIIKIASTVDPISGTNIDTVPLCKDESTILSVEKIVKASEPTAKFDILWFKNRAMLDNAAIQDDEEASASSITVAWEDIPAGESQTYYLKIRDHEKPTSADCFVKDSIVVKANKVPTVPLIEVDPFCEGKLSDADAADIADKIVNLKGLKIYSLENEASADVSEQTALAADIAALTAGDHTYAIKVEDAVTGCLSEDSVIKVKVNAVPEVPAVNDLSMLKEVGVESVEPGATASTGCTINWFTTKNLTDGSTTAPKQDKGIPGTYVYYVSQTSADGCESDTTHFTVTVNDAPKPNTRDTVICKGELVDLVSRVTRLNDTYLLNWYTDANAEKGTGSAIAPEFSETTPGVYTYYVSQTSTETKAESEKASFTVTVAGVDPATILVPETTYCRGEANPASVATMVKLSSDEANYIYADANGMIWTNESGVTLTEAQLVPTTNVELTTTTVYTVVQTYAIPTSPAVCKGDPVSVTVNVTVVDVPKGDLVVNYLKSDAADNGGKFTDLLTKNPTVATPDAGCSLVWYDANGTKLTSAPVPPYNANQSEDVELVYYVSQVNANGCESETTKVVVTISTAPMPTANHVAYCEGDPEATTTALTANIQTTGTGNDSESDYVLVWYGQTNPNDLTNEQKAALESSAPFPANKITDGSTKQVFTYYVAQKNIGSGAVSRAVAVCDTVFARPVLVTRNPSPVCEPATIDLSSKEIWNDAVPQNWVMAWLDETKQTPATSPTSVQSSGTYYAQAYFMVQGKQCLSDLAEINVEVHFIRDLAIDGSNTTCPGTGVDLTAKYSKINPDLQATFKWTSAGAGDDPAPIQNVTYSTPNLKGPAGNTYTYSLTASAGACVGISGGNHLITIGDGPVEGKVSFSEEGNAGSALETVNEPGLTFYSCGEPINIDLSGVTSGSEFTWSLAGGVVNTGSTYTIENPTNATYRVEYVNNCKTGFDIKIVNVPVLVVPSNTPVEVCDGEDFGAELNVSCVENSYKIAWFQDGVEMIGQSDKSLKFSPATPANNGVYSYKVTNRGCTVEGEIAEGKAVKVKPYIEFDVQKEYIVRNGDPVSIPLNITVPAVGEPSSIEWYESGVSFASGNPLAIDAVTADHTLNVKMSDENYCSAESSVTIRKDARLQLSAELDEQMCSGESRMLIIDTTGTGKFLFPSVARLYIIETENGFSNKVTGGWSLKEGLLYYQTKPTSDATYQIIFEYRVGDADEQSETITKSLKVLPPIEIELPTDLKLCGNGENDYDVELVSVSPSGTLVTWDEDESIISGRDGSLISINPLFDESRTSNSYYKTYSLHASYSVCSEVIKYVSVRVDRPLTGDIKAPEVICESSVATLDASSYNATTYSWTSTDDEKFPEEAVSAAVFVAPVAPSTYNVAMTRGECSAEDSWSIYVSEKPEIVSIDSLKFHQREIQVSGGATPYLYFIKDVTPIATSESVIDNIPFGMHAVDVVDAAGCRATALFNVVSPGLVFPKVISPNGDGVKDVFSTEILQEAYPNSVIRIFDRWGKKLAEYNGSASGWDGTYNGKMMPSTDYWYEVEIKELQKTYTGHFTLMRQ